MSAKKWVTWITFIISVLALITMVVIGKNSNSIGYDIALACLGSAILGCIMSLTEYFAERRKAMELFWIESQNVLKELRKIKYLDCDAPTDLVIKCFHEEEQNRIYDEHPEIQSVLEIDQHTAKNEMLKWFQENNKLQLLENDDDRDAYYSKSMVDYRKSFQDCIESYCRAAEIRLSSLDNAYGNLDFLFGNIRLRRKTYENIFDKLRQYRNKILEEVYHFELLKNKKGNFAICAQKTVTLNQFFFDEKEKVDEEFKSLSAYQTKFDDIEEVLENFRCKIYRNTEEEIPERRPAFMRMTKL